MPKNAGQESQDARSSTKKSKSSEWRSRREFARFLKREREEAGLNLAASPNEVYQKAMERDEPARVPDLDYLIRLLMLFHREKSYEPSASRLRSLFVLWIFARLEHALKPEKEPGAKLEGFKGEILKDFKIKPNDPPGVLDDQTNNFDYYWGASGLTVQQNLRDALYPIIKAPPQEEEEVAPPGPGRFPTLAHFPKYFSPLKVIVGDYVGGRNHAPKRVGELFRLPPSAVNLHYLLQLNLPDDTEIISDRLLLDLKNDAERAEQLLGDSHVLVIGSPLVNSVSRHLVLRKKLAFNFVCRKDVYGVWNDFYDEIKNTGYLDTSEAVAMFEQMMNTPGRINVRAVKFSDKGVNEERRKKIKNEVLKLRRALKNSSLTSDVLIDKYFRPDEYFSPFESGLQSCMGERDEAFAVISLGENFWTAELPKDESRPKRALIAVCGQDGVSTAVALKALKYKYRTSFRSRPLGGVLRINLSGHNGPKRVTESRFHWLSKEYKPSEMLARLARVSKSVDKNRGAYTPLFNSKEDLESYKKIVTQYIEE